MHGADHLGRPACPASPWESGRVFYVSTRCTRAMGSVESLQDNDRPALSEGLRRSSDRASRFARKVETSQPSSQVNLSRVMLRRSRPTIEKKVIMPAGAGTRTG